MSARTVAQRLTADPEAQAAVEKALGELDDDGAEAVLHRLDEYQEAGGALGGGELLRAVEVARDAVLRARREGVANRPPEKPGRKKAPHAAQGREVKLPDTEPWPETVDGAALLDESVQTLRRFVALPEGGAETLALWAIHAHAHDLGQVSPILCVTSPTIACGKSTLLALLRPLVPRPLPTGNMSPAAVFRSVEAFRPTLLIDEGDTFISEDREELRGLLCQGHLKGTLALRVGGDPPQLRAFPTWCPKAIALVGRLHESLRSRSITVEMRRRKKSETVERLRLADLGGFAHLGRKACRWVADNAGRLEGMRPHLPVELGDRDADNWEPLLAVAEVAGGAWPSLARMAAVRLSTVRATEGVAERLLADVRDVWETLDREAQAVGRERPDRLASADLVKALVAVEDGPWSDFDHGRPIGMGRVARLLSGFGIESGNIRLPDGRTPKGYKRAAFSEPFARWLPSEDPSPGGKSATAPQPSTGADCGASESATGSGDVALLNNATMQAGSGESPICGAVAVSPGVGEADATCPACGGRMLRWASGEICTVCHRRLQDPARGDAYEGDLEGGQP